MRKYSGMILFFVLIMLIVPAFALIGQNSGTILWNTPNLDVPDFSSLTPTEYQENRFYLIQNHKTGEIMALSPADYVKGVVAAEMPVSFHTEALKAQAVAAHTYALRQISQQLDSPSSDLKGAYLSTDPAKFQAYLSPEELRKKWGKNYDLYWKKLSDAVDSVINEVIVCDGEPIIAAFHSISSGMTESAENVWGQDVSYLEPVKSEGDELSPEFETASVLKEAEVAHALLAKFPGIKLSEDRSRWFTIAKRSDSGTITELKAGDQETSGREIRELFQLKSANFTVTFQDGKFTFDCLGYGHGVGMSQYGADYLARQGMTYEEILTHYYTGVTITTTTK